MSEPGPYVSGIRVSYHPDDQWTAHTHLHYRQLGHPSLDAQAKMSGYPTPLDAARDMKEAVDRIGAQWLDAFPLRVYVLPDVDGPLDDDQLAQVDHANRTLFDA